MQTATTPTSGTAPAHTPALRHELGMLLGTMRRNINALVQEAAVFTAAEKLRTNDSVYQSQDVAQLQRWFRNVYRVRQEREATATAAADSTITAAAAALPVLLEEAAPALMWLVATDATPTTVKAAAVPRPRSTSDYAGELACAARQSAFLAETGLSYSDLLSL